MKNIGQLQDIRIEEKILSVLTGGDILLIVPPFSGVHYPFFALHILQSIAEERGYKTEILYLNTLLTSIIGIENTNKITFTSQFAYWKMLGERLFARSAYGLPPLGKIPEFCLDEAMCINGNKNGYVKTHYENEVYDLETLKKIENICKSFIDITVPLIASLEYKIVGCTIQFGQTNAGIAILNGIEKAHPDTLTLIGGANCEGEMAEGIASLSESIDYIFSGESEISFINFLEGYSKGELSSKRIIRGKPLEDLDSLPLPGYDDYLKQLDIFLGSNISMEISIAYETSRGCWWGQKRKCSFCGLANIQFRQKSVTKVLGDLDQLKNRYPNRRIEMTDDIMPFSFFRKLIPELSRKNYSNIIYCLKANLKLKQLVNLKEAQIDMTVPGIEALSSGLLKLLNKGVTARNNLYLLRNARSLGIYLYWHILWGIPGDKAAYYRETLNLIPLIRHLQPPRKLNHIQLNRFSSYTENPSYYHISNIRPWEVYNMIYPEWTDIGKLAFFFAGDYPCESHTHPELIQELYREWELWKKMWEKARLVMIPLMDFYVIYDSRNIDGKRKKHTVDKQQAGEIMSTCFYDESETLKWALEEKLGVVVDSWYVPLVTASPKLLFELELKNE